MSRSLATLRSNRTSSPRAGRVADGQTSMLPVRVRRARGCWVETDDGRLLLDLTSGMATLNLGHGHPRVMAAAQAQLERLVHVGGVSCHEPMDALARRLGEIAPAGIDSFLFSASGSEAVEIAVGAARRLSRRPVVVAFRGGFHGRTLGSLSCSSARPSMRPTCPRAGVTIAPFPRPFEWRLDPHRAADAALARLDEVHRHDVAPSETACYLIEPVQGLGGCHPAGRRFLEGLRERADRNGALLVFDEVQTGLGRTGEWFAADRFGVVPDMLCLAKALGSGFPLGAVGAPAALLAPLGSGWHGSTFGGNPLSCAVALAAIDVIEDEGLLVRAAVLGIRARRRLRALAARYPVIGDVRGTGLMIGAELVHPVTRAPLTALAEAVQAAALRDGALLVRSGEAQNVIRLLPPLVLSDAELDEGLAIVERAFAEALGHRLDRTLASARDRAPRSRRR